MTTDRQVGKQTGLNRNPGWGKKKFWALKSLLSHLACRESEGSVLFYFILFFLQRVGNPFFFFPPCCQRFLHLFFFLKKKNANAPTITDGLKIKKLGRMEVGGKAGVKPNRGSPKLCCRKKGQKRTVWTGDGNNGTNEEKKDVRFFKNILLA